MPRTKKEVKVGTADDLGSGDQNIYAQNTPIGEEGDTSTCTWCARMINVVTTSDSSGNPYCSIECYNKNN